jgi:hypothetical protein
MTPETRFLADQAERIRMDSIRLCQETRETLRNSENLRTESECLRGELGRAIGGFVERAQRAVRMSRDAEGWDAPMIAHNRRPPRPVDESVPTAGEAR